jgi:hypothetical protein
MTRQRWAVIGTRKGETLVLDTARTQAAAEALRDRYAEQLEQYESIVVERLPNRLAHDRPATRRAPKRQPRLPRGGRARCHRGANRAT